MDLNTISLLKEQKQTFIRIQNDLDKKLFLCKMPNQKQKKAVLRLLIQGINSLITASRGKDDKTFMLLLEEQKLLEEEFNIIFDPEQDRGVVVKWAVFISLLFLSGICLSALLTIFLVLAISSIF